MSFLFYNSSIPKVYKNYLEELNESQKEAVINTDGSYLVSGKKISCFTDDEERHVKLEKEVPFLLESKLISLGANHTKADKFQPHVEIDNRVITAQNPPSSSKFGETLVENLKNI